MSTRGIVIKRGKTYSVVLDLGRGGADKRIRKWHSGFATKRDAEKARTELLAQLDKGSYVAPTAMTVAAFLDEWQRSSKVTLRGEHVESVRREYRRLPSAGARREDAPRVAAV
jgi:hypothetical protein